MGLGQGHTPGLRQSNMSLSAAVRIHMSTSQSAMQAELCLSMPSCTGACGLVGDLVAVS